MNHCVPDFETEDHNGVPTSSGTSRQKKSFLPEDDIMELLWQNGQILTQSQNQRSQKKSPADVEIRSSQRQEHEASAHHYNQDQHLFMQEDEMASWLHYPLDDEPSLDHNFSADLFYTAPSVTTTNSTLPESRPPVAAASSPSPAPRPPIPPSSRPKQINVQNFENFLKARVESGPPCSKKVARESTTVVDSCDTPAVGPGSRVSNCNLGSRTMNGGGVAGTSSDGGGKEVVRYEGTMTSSPGCSSGSAEPIPAKKPAKDRKRKGREVVVDDGEYQSEDIDFEFSDAKKQLRGTTSTKRARAAEVHNLSERRRRDRINEKMKALQELIPRCNKSDKASMLDEAIEYLKSLQLQVQMMSMGCGMVPMMFPGMQQYMPTMGMGMGMGMGMEMGMNRPMMPFPNVLPGSAMTTPAHLGPRFPMAAYHMPVPASAPSRPQATNQSEHMLQSFGIQNPNQSQIPNFSDHYQQYLGSQQMQLPQQQNQPMVQPNASKPSTSRGPENHENHQSG
ncbi:hypothetical protein UlMin_031797 [Ulmus minor]